MNPFVFLSVSVVWMIGVFFGSFFVSGTVFSASQVYIPVNEELELQVQNTSSKSSVEWVVSQDGTLLETKKGRTFRHTFTKQGEYIIRTSLTDSTGNRDTSVVYVSVENNLPNFSPLSAHIASIPRNNDGSISLAGESEEVTFSFRESTGDISEYRFDADVFSDSDGDGIIDNDIDNKNDPSFLSGTFYSHTYTNTGLPAQAVLTVLGKDGDMEEERMMILFESNTKVDTSGKKLKAVLHTLPESDESGNILFPKTGGTLLLFPGESEGSITEYALDIDGDEKADNTDTESFSSGEVYALEMDSLEEEQLISLTVSDADGEMHRITKTLTPSSFSQIPPSGKSYLSPLLFTSRSKILEGESITFKVFNASEESTFSWDFDGDGTLDRENVAFGELEYKYTEEGVYTVQVYITEVGSTPIIQKRTITVLNKNEGQIKTSPPKASFLPQFEGNKVSFLSLESKADARLLNTDLSFSWDFGDGYKTEGPNPVHIYESTGEYVVILTVQDSIGREAVFSQTISIADLDHEFDSMQHGGIAVPEKIPAEDPLLATDLIEVQDEPPVESPVSSVTPSSSSTPASGREPQPSSEEQKNGFSFPWWILLILFLLFLPFLFLFKKKIDTPDKSFSEIFSSLIAPPKKPDPAPEVDFLTSESVEVSESQKNNKEEETQNIEPEEDATTPDWMRNYDEKEESNTDVSFLQEEEGKSDENNLFLEESSQESLEQNTEQNIVNPIQPEDIFTEQVDESVQDTQNTTSVPPLKEGDGSVPDWMIGADEIEETNQTQKNDTDVSFLQEEEGKSDENNLFLEESSQESLEKNTEQNIVNPIQPEDIFTEQADENIQDTQNTTSVPPLEENDGVVPDWMVGADEIEETNQTQKNNSEDSFVQEEPNTKKKEIVPQEFDLKKITATDANVKPHNNVKNPPEWIQGSG